MNTDNINKVIEFFGTVLADEDFDQVSVGDIDFSSPIPECHTPGCIAGWTVALCGDERTFEGRYQGRILPYAADLLFGTVWSGDEYAPYGDDQARQLFYAFPKGGIRVTVADAIKALEHLRDKGWVRWH